MTMTAMTTPLSYLLFSVCIVSVFVCLYFAGVSKTDISPSCLVENFTDVAVYTVPCAGKNVVLKYQGQGAVDLRRLTTTKVIT
jgi:hypothetical protein